MADVRCILNVKSTFILHWPGAQKEPALSSLTARLSGKPVHTFPGPLRRQALLRHRNQSRTAVTPHFLQNVSSHDTNREAHFTGNIRGNQLNPYGVVSGNIVLSQRQICYYAGCCKSRRQSVHFGGIRKRQANTASSCGIMPRVSSKSAIISR